MANLRHGNSLNYFSLAERALLNPKGNEKFITTKEKPVRFNLKSPLILGWVRRARSRPSMPRDPPIRGKYGLHCW